MPTYNVALLGTEGTGKSCFLAGLNYIGSNPMNDLAITVSPLMDEPVAKKYLADATAKLSSGQFPTGTTETTFLEFDVQIKNDTMRIKTMDYPGECFRDGITKDTPREKIKEFAQHLLNSDIIIWLADPNALLKTAENTKERDRIINSVNANLQAAREVLKEQKVKVKEIKFADICIAIGKFDKLPEYEQVKLAKDGGQKIAKDYFKEHFPNVVQNLANSTGITVKEIAYFPISAVGNTIETEDLTSRDNDGLAPDKDNLVPFGYDTMFHWIKDRKDRLATRRFLQRVSAIGASCIAVLVVLAVLFLGNTTINAIEEQRQLASLENGNISVVARLEDTQPPVSSEVAKRRTALLDEELERYKELIAQTDDEQQLQNFRIQLEEYNSLITGDRHRDVENLIAEISKKVIDVEFQRVKDTYAHAPLIFPAIANDFLRNHSSSAQANDVRRMLTEFEKRNYDNFRKTIRAMHVSDAGSLRGKRDKIVEFLNTYRGTTQLSIGEADAMQRAVDLAKQFGEPQNYTVNVNQYGGFERAAYQFLKISVGNNDVYEHKSTAASQTVNPGNQFTVKWQCGETLKIELQGASGWGFGWRPAAEMSSRTPDAIKLFHGRVALNTKSNNWTGNFFVNCSIAGISDQDWKHFENYILPGNAW